MLKNLKPVVTAAFVVAVLSISATVFAGNTASYTDECCFPGVDYYGCLDWEKGNDLCTKVCVNKRTCAVTITAKGVVENCSGRKQCYRNQVTPGCWWVEYICFKSSIYTVDKYGCANYTACGKLTCCYADYNTAMTSGGPT